MNRPWISTNLAISADGKISSVTPRPSGWTSPADHQRLLDLRRGADALMVGHSTLASDRMTLRVPGADPQPLRCIISRQGAIDPRLPVFHQPGGAIHLLATHGATPPELPGGTGHVGSLGGFLETLARDFAVRRLHCEGGGMLIAGLAELDAIDEFHLTLAGHTLFGGSRAPTATGVPGLHLPKSVEFELSRFHPCPATGECFLSYVRREPALAQGGRVSH